MIKISYLFGVLVVVVSLNQAEESKMAQRVINENLN